MNRLIIYFHFDVQGIIDEPCRFAVQAMAEQGDVFFVTNGMLQPESRLWLQKTGTRFLERENVGFDVGAYRAALFALSKEELQPYDELILMNYTLAGPVMPLLPMFAAMDARPALGFWGLSRHYAMRSRRFGGQVPEHLQSHFLAIRSALFLQDVFWNYWKKMPLPNSYEESVQYHETRFTAYFAKQGFAWDSYLQTDDLKHVFINPIMACPRELIAHRGCPFFKRRSFFTPYADELRRTDGGAAAELQAYLQTKTKYPVEPLLRSLLRTQPLSALAQNLHWRYEVAPYGSASDEGLREQGLKMVRFEPLHADAVTRWYLEQAAEKADEVLGEAIRLFAENPLLGVLSPSVPAWPDALRAHKESWQMFLLGQSSASGFVTDAADPPPFSCTGWVLVRSNAFPQGIPATEEPWLFPLVAQQSGYYSATFETTIQAATRAEQLQIYMNASADPKAVLKQCARLVKHSLHRKQKGR